MDFLPIVEGRSCQGCTKCCEGYLRAELGKEKYFMGQNEDGTFTPCPFVKINEGCGVYNARPVTPCQTFKCDYLTDASMPESFKPSNSNTIFSTRTIKNIQYTMLIEAGRKLDSEVLSWAIEKHLSEGTNFAWRVLGNIFWIGSEEFNNMMNEDYPLLAQGTSYGTDIH
jgi:hypothetical protein